MTSIAAAAPSVGQGITFGDVGAGIGAGAATLVGSATAGAIGGGLIGDRLWKGGPGAGLGIVGGAALAAITGIGAAAATGTTVFAMREPGRDLTAPGAIAGAVGGGLVGAGLSRIGSGGGGGWQGAVGIIGFAAITGALAGALGGSLAD